MTYLYEFKADSYDSRAEPVGDASQRHGHRARTLTKQLRAGHQRDRTYKPDTQFITPEAINIRQTYGMVY